MFARPILIEHTDADTEHVYFLDLHPSRRESYHNIGRETRCRVPELWRRQRSTLYQTFRLCTAGRFFLEGRCSKSSKSLGRAVARLFRRKEPIPM
jgi:hypothetical protein